jgi:FHS family L-fucose permease-like MFS transporter|tara:strand:+ start:4049 stop:4372 length:324 start_codon:yes stop_codon:yes gene_type:complete
MSNSHSLPAKNATLVPIIIIAGLFFIFGSVTWINGALIPFMKTINELASAQSYLVALVSYISFVLMALPASYILSDWSQKNIFNFAVFPTRHYLVRLAIEKVCPWGS